MTAFAQIKIEGVLPTAGLCDGNQWMCVMVEALTEERGHMVGIDTHDPYWALVMVAGGAPRDPRRYYEVRRYRRGGSDDRVVQLTEEEAKAWARARGPAHQVALAVGLAPYPTAHIGGRMYVNGDVISGWRYAQESGWSAFAVGDGVTQEMRDEMGTPEDALAAGIITQEQCDALNAHRVEVMESWMRCLKASGRVLAEVYGGAETVREAPAHWASEER